MKKLIAIALVMALLTVCGAALAESMMVHITAVCYDPNHVGTRWQGNFTMGGYPITDGDVVDVVPGKYEFYSQLGEYDNSPDIGETLTTYNVTSSRINKGFSLEHRVEVYENQGSYKGYWCEWYVDFEFIPIGDSIYLAD